MPLFKPLTLKQIDKLASLFRRVSFEPGAIIVREGDPVDSFFVIAEGRVEVTHRREILAMLHKGESIGLSDTGFYSKTGTRTATATALTHVDAFKIELNDFNQFLRDYPDLIPDLLQQSDQLVKLNFIKQLEPFQELKLDLVSQIAQRIETWKVLQDHVFFHEGEAPDCCYLLCEGKIQLVRKSLEGMQEEIAQLEPFALFGEMGILMNQMRNATAIAIEPCKVLILKKEDLQILLEYKESQSALVSSLIYRVRPEKKKGVTVHERIDAKGDKIVILKNEELGNYFKTSEEGLFIWNLFDGFYTLSDIAVLYFYKYNKLIVEDLMSFVFQLSNSGFFQYPLFPSFKGKEKFSDRIITLVTKIFTHEWSIKNVDAAITRLYNRFGFLFFTKIAQISMATLFLVGLIFFILLTEKAGHALNTVRHAWTFLIYANLSIILTVPLHELAHAFSTKAFGYQVHRFGVGWFWLAPMAYADTSDMWLASRGQRVIVNLAGIYINWVIAGILSICAWYSGPQLMMFFWLAALFNYSLGFGNLNPVIELDGYYVLMDSFDKTNLRFSATQWLLESREFSKRYSPEIFYWIISFVYIFSSSFLSYFIQNHVVLPLLPANIQHYFSGYFRYLFSALTIVIAFAAVYKSAKKLKSIKAK